MSEEEKPRDLRLPAALVRTALSSEQSLMSWIRTSLSMIAFGFSITQFFQYLAEKQEDLQISTGPRRLGIALVCVGVFSLVLATIDYVQRIRKMKDEGLPADGLSRLPLGSAVSFLVIGLLALITVVMNWSL